MPEIVNGSWTPTENELDVSRVNLAQKYGVKTSVLSANAEEELTKINTDISETTSLLRRTMRANGVYELRDMTYNTSFYRFKRWDPYHLVEGTREYVFFIKPQLEIMVNSNLNTSDHHNFAVIPYFKNLFDLGYGPTVLGDLSAGSGGDSCPFIRILTNRIASPVDIPEIRVDALETSQNMYGTKLFYPKSSMKSDEDVEFNIEFEDTPYLEIYLLFKTWDYYRKLKWLGVIRPADSFIQNKILSDHISIYKFIVDNDGESILYYCKWTGVFPNLISRNSFGEIPERGPFKVVIGFKQSGWFEDMDPMILSEFQAIVTRWRNTYEATKLWDDEIGMISGENVDVPYIAGPYDDNNLYHYKRWLLKWGKLK